MSEGKQPLFERLSKIDVSAFTEKKNGLTYLSWAHAWRAFKKECPDATYEILHLDNDMSEGIYKGMIVWTSVSAEGETHKMWLPVMDFRNKAILEPDAMDVNKAIMRCLTKNLAMFGLGIYIYAGEDLPDESEAKAAPKKPAPKKPAPKGPTKEQVISALKKCDTIELLEDKYAKYLKTDLAPNDEIESIYTEMSNLL